MPLPRGNQVAAVRAVVVLLVLLGVVSMHQLAGGHHRSAANATHGRHQAQPAAAAAGGAVVGHAPVLAEGPSTGTLAPSDPAPQLPMTDGHRPAPPTGVVPSSAPVALVALDSALAGTGAEHDGMPACLAVLTALLVLLLPVLAHLLPLPARPPLVRRCRTSPPARGPPRDLLSQLCVLRT